MKILFENPKKVLLVWACAIVLTAAIHLGTLLISPPFWQDEIQILDYGRVLFAQGTEWGMTWHADGRPVFALSYLGCGLQELAYRIFAPQPLGPRVASLLGAIFAGAMCYGWLRARKTRPVAAALCSMSMLLDPLFAQGYRGARVDCWAIGLALGACWLLRIAHAKENASASEKWFVLAGVFTGLCGMAWISSALLIPLVFLEAGIPILTSSLMSQRLHSGKMLVVFILSACICVAMCLLPIIAQIPLIMADMSQVLGRNLQIGAQHAPFAGIQILPFLLTMKISPVLPLFAFLCFLLRKDWWLLAALLISALVISTTMVYVHRVVYLLPYLVGLIANAFPQEETLSWPPPRRSFWVWLALATVCLWAAGITLVLRPVRALAQRRERDPELLVQMSQKEIGSGPIKVYTDCWETYYAGRSLGWRLYTGTVYGNADHEKRLKTMDYIIVKNIPETKEIVDRLVEIGFQLKTESLVQKSGARNYDKLKSSKIGGQGYGPYLILKNSTAMKLPK